MGFDTKIFGLFYKRVRTGSFVYVTGSSGVNLFAGNVLTGSANPWYDTDFVGSYKISSSFLNFPADGTTPPFYATTRQSSSNAGYVAVPWGSMAADFLWNVKTPRWTSEISQSHWTFFYASSYITGGFMTASVWSVILDNTGSFFRQIGAAPSVGVESYNITSSWYVWDPKFQNLSGSAYGSGTYLRYATTVTSTNGLGLTPGSYNITSSYMIGRSGRPAGNTPGAGTDYSSFIGYDITWPNTGSTNAISEVDNQYFDRGGGVAISRALVSQSLLTQSIYANSFTTLNLRAYYTGLRNRRLYYPTPVSASGTVGSHDVWHKAITGFAASEVFDENGGIYNVQFVLKRHVGSDHYPDSGSYLNVFIHNVSSTNLPNPTQRVAGANGWYPPSNNIVTIGHAYNGGPAMNFYDVQTGYLYERFNINLVQYGLPAQLCIEPSGSLADNKFFGIIVDDISICKVGVTTDPRFIKPTTIGATYTAQTGEAQQYDPNQGTSS